MSAQDVFAERPALAAAVADGAIQHFFKFRSQPGVPVDAVLLMGVA
jgi:hypothetical protein